jgi:nucleoid-associated protein YgaU
VAAVVVVACGAALVLGYTQLWREPPVETKAATAAVAPASGAQDQGPAALATAQAEANAVTNALAVSPRTPDADPSVPAFDVARIEQTGEAVIAGRAAPGATVELLRNGERLDRAVADQAGQFVMTPSRLPPGNYPLTLRSSQPDGKQAMSKESVAVALAGPEPGSGGVVRSHAELPANAPETVATIRPAMNRAAPSSQAPQMPLPSGGSAPSGAVAPKMATAVVSRGDSLWRISRLSYGEGTRYAVVYNANRDQIRNPNRIYPGQVFVLPLKTP